MLKHFERNVISLIFFPKDGLPQTVKSMIYPYILEHNFHQLVFIIPEKGFLKKLLMHNRGLLCR